MKVETQTRVSGRDGAAIMIQSHGSGPGIVVVHGGGVVLELYRRFAIALADRFTVHLYNRRGRAGAAPKTADYTVQQDIDDLAAILQETGSRTAVGHSGGGFVVLEAALQLPLDRIALYDPAVSVDGMLPTAFLDDFAVAITAGQRARALALMSRGMRAAGKLSTLPLPVQQAMSALFLKTPIGRQMGDLLPATLQEVREIKAHEGPAGRYAPITADTLLATGAWSPPCYVGVNEALAGAVAHSRTLIVPKAAHDAINIARPGFVEPFASFFGAPQSAR